MVCGRSGNSSASPQSLLWSAGVQQDGNYAPGTQLSNVNGDVLKWHNDLGAQSVSAQVYIQQLEAEIAHLKQQQVRPAAPSVGGQKPEDGVVACRAGQSPDGVEHWRTLCHLRRDSGALCSQQAAEL